MNKRFAWRCEGASNNVSNIPPEEKYKSVLPNILAGELQKYQNPLSRVTVEMQIPNLRRGGIQKISTSSYGKFERREPSILYH